MRLTGERVLISTAGGTVEASNVTKTSLSYVDATSSIQGQLDAAPSTSSNTTFEENLTCKKTLYVQNTSGGDGTFWMSRSGGYQIFRQEHKGSYVRFRLGDTKIYMYDDGRYKFEGTHLQVPTSDDTPTTNAANSKGGIWLDTSEDPPLLKFHDGYGWKTIAKA